MFSKFILYIISIIMIVMCALLSPESTIFLFPFFVLFVALYYYQSIGKWEITIIAYFIINMITEVAFIIDFEKYYTPAIICSFLSESLLIFILWPLLKLKSNKISSHNLTEVFIGFIGVSTIVTLMLYVIIPKLPNVFLFIPTIFSFTGLMFLCFAIPLFNKHPKHIYLWGVGIGFIGELLMAFVYEYIATETIFMAFAFLSGNFYKLVLIEYLIRINSETEEEEFPI